MTALLNGCKKKVKIEEVPDIKSLEIIKTIENIKSVRKIVKVQLELNSDGDTCVEVPDIKSMEIIKSIENIKSGFVPACLHDVQPPYDKGHGLALLRYNEMYGSNLNDKISQLRERNAASCAKYDAAKNYGPRDGQGRR